MSTPIIYEDISYGQRKNNCLPAVVGLTLGGIGLFAAATVMVLFIKKRSLVGDGNAINIDVGTINVASLPTAAFAEIQPEDQMIKRSDHDVQAMIKEQLAFSPLDGASDGNTMAELNSAFPTGGIMNDPKAQGKKWDHKKMIPNPMKSSRPKGCLADKFGPSPSELASYLPTSMDMWKEQPSGPKYIRRPAPVRTQYDHPIPQSSTDHNRTLRGNKARVNERALQDISDIRRRQYEQMGRAIHA